MKVLSVTISNRTKSKAENLKSLFNDLEIVDWGEASNFDMIINTTSLGLNESDEIKLNYSDIGSNKFYSLWEFSRSIDTFWFEIKKRYKKK